MNIVSYGGGTNSTALLIGLAERNVSIDLITFADTGGEKPHTYKYIKYFSKWLVDNGMPPVQVVQTQNINGTFITLEGLCHEKNMLPSLAYGFKSCSEKHKIRPQNKFVNNWQPAREVWAKGDKVIKYIGYDADEPQRAENGKREDKKYIYRYPLIEWNWGRDQCIEVIKAAGLLLPGKSACFYCPSSRKLEIKQLADQYPDLMRRAIQMEERAELTKVKGLGRSFAWKDYIAAEEAQGDMFPDSIIEIDCGCYDG